LKCVKFKLTYSIPRLKIKIWTLGLGIVAFHKGNFKYLILEIVAKFNNELLDVYNKKFPSSNSSLL
jgi:hypothetical protein